MYLDGTHLPLMRPKPEMLHRLTTILRAPQQQRVRPRRGLQRQLIQRQTLPPGLFDACARRGGEVQRRDGERGHGQQARVVCDGADHYNRLLGRGRFLCVGFGRGVLDEPGEGDGRAVDARHEKASEDDFVEGGVGAA